MQSPCWLILADGFNCVSEPSCVCCQENSGTKMYLSPNLIFKQTLIKRDISVQIVIPVNWIKTSCRMFIREIKLSSLEANWLVSWYCSKRCLFFFSFKELHLMWKVKWGFTEASEWMRRCYLRSSRPFKQIVAWSESIGRRLLFSYFCKSSSCHKESNWFFWPKWMYNFSLGWCCNNEHLTRWVSIRTKWVLRSIFTLNGAFLLNSIFQNFILVSVEYLNRFKF